MTKAALIYPVILSGGAGTRLWPVSRHLRPKQFQPVVSDQTLFAQTIGRLDDSRFAAPLVICNEDHRFLVAEEFRLAGKQPRSIVLEPVPRNTAPAITAAVLLIARDQPDAMIAVFPSDHVVADVPAFYAAIDQATTAAQRGQLATFGITPIRPETGYGYIQAGEPYKDAGEAFSVRKFVEKPDMETAQSYLEAGTYYWNSGMFLFRACDFLEELQLHAPATLDACTKSVAALSEDFEFLKLDQDAFACAPSVSMDYAVMEKTTRAVVIPSDFGWSDVGSWTSLHQLGKTDANGNVSIGDVVLHDSHRSYVRSEGPLVTAVGVDNMVIVATDDAVLIAPADRDQDVRQIVETLHQQGRSEATSHARVLRPWGSYQNRQVAENFLVKETIVNPGAKLSLQYHNHRAEHWVVVEGTARVTRDGEIFDLKTNESTYIPIGMRHRLENPTDAPLHLIEVQTGSLISEDDITRLEDDFGRA